MIGCPSDIKKEVCIAKQVIIEWSCTNAELHNMAILPLHWSTDSYPVIGQHPQKELNHQIVDKSDMLICIFGAKIGTPTDTAESGSIEEIEEHIKAGKPVMVFFRRNIDVSSVNPDELKRLNDFKQKSRTTCMWAEYQDESDFADVLHKKLNLYLNDNWLKQQLISTNTRAPQPQFVLNDDETLIFSRWANDQYNTPYMTVQLRSGLQISLAYHFGLTLKTNEEKAWWEDFIERLMNAGYIKHDTPDKHGHPRYKITKQGYDFAKTLPKFDMNNKLVEV